jgi:hypothetical protein
VDLEVIDDRLNGIKFNGTIDTIYAEMKALKPELFANNTKIMPDMHTLAKRRGGPVGSSSSIITSEIYTDTMRSGSL